MKDDELASILNAKGADGACPFCQTNDWIGETVPNSGHDLAVVAVVSTGETPDATEGRTSATVQIRHEGYLLTCARCGFMRVHNKSIVEDSSNG